MNKMSIIALMYFSIVLSANSVDPMLDSTQNTNTIGQKSQKMVDGYSDKTENIHDKYMKVKRELDEQIAYNKQLDLILATQRHEMPKLQTQLLEIQVTNRKITPLMVEMIEKLEKLVSIDTPFLKKEREKRVESIQSYLSNPDMSTAEQFRAILSSYKIEYNYARTLEAYRSELIIEGSEDKTVDFLRMGRLALYYQSLDLTQCGMYDLEAGEWIVLDESYNEAISKALKMARKKISPDFLTMPVISAKDVK